MKQAQAQTAHPPSIKAMPPLPASVLSAKQSSSDSSLAAFQQSFGSTANPLLDILERIYSELILDITVDIAVQVHKEAHARVGNASVACAAASSGRWLKARIRADSLCLCSLHARLPALHCWTSMCSAR